MLPLRVLPREVRVGLVEAGLGQRAHDGPAGEGLGQEEHLGVLPAHLGDEPLPEGQRLRVRVVDAEDLHAPAHPAQDDLQPRLPEPAPVLAVEVEVVDVLVLLGRVLGVLQRPVGPPVEPLGVLREPRVVGRGVDREVEAELHPVLAQRRDERVEVLPGPQLRVQRVVAAALVADRVRAAGVAGLGDERVVAPLAVRVPDRVDGREVQDVEAELGQPRDLLGRAAQAAPGAREQLVPGAEAAALAVDLERQRRVELLLLGSVAPARGLDERRDLRVEDRAHVAVLLERVGDRGQPALGGAGGALGRLAQEHHALGRLAGQVGLAGLDLAAHLVAPRGEGIGPRPDGVLPAPGRPVDLEAARPPDALVVGVDRGQRRGGPPAGSGRLPAHLGPQHLVAVPEDVDRDVDDVADGPLDRPAPTVDDRGRVLDADAGRRLRRLSGGHRLTHSLLQVDPNVNFA